MKQARGLAALSMALNELAPILKELDSDQLRTILRCLTPLQASRIKRAVEILRDIEIPIPLPLDRALDSESVQP